MSVCMHVCVCMHACTCVCVYLCMCVYETMSVCSLCHSVVCGLRRLQLLWHCQLFFMYSQLWFRCSCIYTVLNGPSTTHMAVRRFTWCQTFSPKPLIGSKYISIVCFNAFRPYTTNLGIMYAPSEKGLEPNSRLPFRYNIEGLYTGS